MSVSSILNSGLQSMQASINRTASAGSGLNIESSDMASNMVAMRQGEIDAKAAANVIKAGDEILGTLIDLTA
jgi:hypothetical protein